MIYWRVYWVSLEVDWPLTKWFIESHLSNKSRRQPSLKSQKLTSKVWKKIWTFWPMMTGGTCTCIGRGAQVTGHPLGCKPAGDHGGCPVTRPSPCVCPGQGSPMKGRLVPDMKMDVYSMDLSAWSRPDQARYPNLHLVYRVTFFVCGVYQVRKCIWKHQIQ